MRITYCLGVSRSHLSSFIFAGLVLKGMPNKRSSSLRRGEAEARISFLVVTSIENFITGGESANNHPTRDDSGSVGKGLDPFRSPISIITQQLEQAGKFPTRDDKSLDCFVPRNDSGSVGKGLDPFRVSKSPIRRQWNGTSRVPYKQSPLPVPRSSPVFLCCRFTQKHSYSARFI